jgi:hypothetical protein
MRINRGMSIHTWTTMAIAAVAALAARIVLGRGAVRSVRVRTVTAVVLTSLAVMATFAVAGAGLVGSTGSTAVAAHPSLIPPGPTHRDAGSNKPIVGMASTPDGRGYWQVASDGGVFSFGDANFYGSTGNIHLNQPIVNIAATPDGDGYWLVASDGGIFSFGDAAFFGSTGNIHLNRPIVGMTSTSDGRGYWLVASDGGIFSFGDASFLGSTGNIHLNQPIVGMAATPTGHGYWLVASDGGIFSFGDATFYGSTGNIHLNQPIVGMAATSDGHGYWMVASDGGIFSFGDATFFGSMGGSPLNARMVTMAVHRSGTGYWTVASDGGLFSFGGAPFLGSLVSPAAPSSLALGNPPANVPPNPNFLNSCYPHTTGATCMTKVIQATTNARAAEGLGPMALPSNFNSLTPAQQIFVITNIERVDRGLPPFVGLVDTFSTDAQSGAQSNADPSPTQVPPGLHLVAWGSNWAENGNPLGSNYFWMYDDGLNSGNIDCTTTNQSGCWGHRENILSLSDYQHQYGGTLLMGASEVDGSTGNGWESDAELMVLATGPVPPFSYTWSQAVAAGAG